MIAPDEFREVAIDRARSMPVRLLAAGVICLCDLIMHGSALPIVWLVAVVGLQLAAGGMLRPLRRRASAATPGLWRLFIVVTLLNSTLFSAIAIQMWFIGGSARTFGCIMLCGTLLHAALLRQGGRAYATATLATPVLLLVALPTLNLLRDQSAWREGLIMTLGALIYIGHLMVTIRQSRHAFTEASAAREEALRAKAHAERASAAKSDFLATISHEIRTPMNAVISAADLLRGTELTDQQGEYVAMLVNGGETLLGLVNDVLDLSKIESGKLAITPTDTAVRDVLAEVIALWEPRASEKGLSLRVSFEQSLELGLRTDPLRLKQIVGNLMSNAIKFTDAGEVSISAGIDAPAGVTKRWLWVEVQDTGCGIAPDVQERLFQRFEQADSATTRRFGGTGLGLAISRRLAVALGGDVTLQSELGHGSVFRLELAGEAVAQAQGDEEVSGPDESVDNDRPLSILVAEDHAVNRRILSLFLEPLGWRLSMAENGLEAVEAAGREPFDAILMDMQMPVMSGLEAAAAIRAGAGPNRRTPIVALTANAFDEQRVAWAAVGANGFLTKPIDARLLIATVEAVTTAAEPAVQSVNAA